MAWTEDRVELLKKLWSEGYSASQIAAQLGEVTRNAVIGKAHRLGLSGRQSTRPSAARPAPAARGNSTSAAPPRPSTVGAAAAGQQPQVSAVSSTVLSGGGAARKLETVASLDAQTAEELDLAPTPLRVIDGARPGTVTLLDLKERMCKWPIGDPGDEDFRFCGGRAIQGQPYCDDHCAMAFQPSNRSRGAKN